jgi:hypothetical protein
VTDPLAIPALLTAAATALGGDRLSAPILLTGGSDRSAVLRCRSAAHGSVVLKAYPVSDEGTAAFAAEAAGLAFTSGSGAAPDLLGTAASALLIVMADLGVAPSLADLLLGVAPGDAGAAFTDWAGACAALAVRTAGDQQRFADLRDSYQASAGAAGEQVHWLERRVRQIPALLADLSFQIPAGLDADLAEVVALIRAAEFKVFSPGDLCPDNNLIATDGIRFIDFESAEFHSVFLDAAYLRMPFSSCWCVFRLPEPLAAAAELAYREQLAGVFADLADDELWLAGVRRGMAAWTLHAMTYLLRPSVKADGSMNSEAASAPTARQLLRYRWAQLQAELTAADDLPALRTLMSDLLAATSSWPVPELPGYPAFR